MKLRVVEQRTAEYRILNKIKRQLFGILSFGYCDLFGICYLKFKIYLLLNSEHERENPRSLKHVVRKYPLRT